MIRINFKVIAVVIASIGSLIAMDAEAGLFCGKRCQANRERAVQNAIEVLPCYDPGTGAKLPNVKVFNPDRSRRGRRVVRRGKVALPPGTIFADSYDKMCKYTRLDGQMASPVPSQQVSPYGTAPNYPGYYYGNQGGTPPTGFSR